MEALALVGGLGVTAMLMVGVVLVYFLLIFFVGLMLYYFTGSGRTGGKILSTLMRRAGRFYSHLWMLLMALTAMLGFSLFVKSVLGVLFEDFVYRTTRYGTSAEMMQKADLQTGLILFVLALVIYLVHWGFAYLIELPDERKGTVITKLLNTLGLFATSFAFFGALIIFVFDLVSGTRAGGSLAWVLGAFPFWLFYALRVIWVVKNEIED